MAASTGDDGRNKQQATEASPIDDDDDLFELDIDLRHNVDGRRGHDHHLRGRRHCGRYYCADDDDDAVVTDEDDDGRGGHALLANCLLPVSSVSNAVPVSEAGFVVSTSSYSGYNSSSRRRLFFTAGTGSNKWSPFGRSARFCFSSRGLETMGSYFQRY